jgi:hypothetical protein
VEVVVVVVVVIEEERKIWGGRVEYGVNKKEQGKADDFSVVRRAKRKKRKQK